MNRFLVKLLTDLLDIQKNLKNSLKDSLEQNEEEPFPQKESLRNIYLHEPSDLEAQIAANPMLFLERSVENKESSNESGTKNRLWSLQFFENERKEKCVEIEEASVYNLKTFLDFVIKVFEEIFYNKKIRMFHRVVEGNKDSVTQLRKQRYYLLRISKKQLKIMLDYFNLVLLNKTYKIDFGNMFDDINHFSSSWGSFIKKIRFSYNEDPSVKTDIEEFIKNVYSECSSYIIKTIR